MNKKTLILSTIIIGLAIFLINSRPQEVIPSEKSSPNISTVPTTTPTSKLKSQTQTFGAVTVEVSPSQVIPEKPSIFKLSLNTHSVDLSYDYAQIATLTDDLGNTYRAVEWTGQSGGHHLQGELFFDKLKTESKKITLTLAGINNQTKKFTWQI